MTIEGPVASDATVQSSCEAILRSLPDWFAIETSLMDYVRATAQHPTFVARDAPGTVVGFITMQEHFPHAWEVHCIAVHAAWRGKGVGRQLLERGEAWAAEHGAQFVQVKTLAPARVCEHYAQTREFYLRAGFLPLEVFPTLWNPRNPCLQMVKTVRPAAVSLHSKHGERGHHG